MKRQVVAGIVEVVVRFLGVSTNGRRPGARPSVGIEHKYMDSFHLVTLLGRYNLHT